MTLCGWVDVLIAGNCVVPMMMSNLGSRSTCNECSGVSLTVTMVIGVGAESIIRTSPTILLTPTEVLVGLETLITPRSGLWTKIRVETTGTSTCNSRSAVVGVLRRAWSAIGITSLAVVP